MKPSQSSLAIIGILYAVIGLGCADDDANNRSSSPIGPLLLASLEIAFVSARDGNDGIYVMNPDGTNVVKITKNAGAYYDFPDWSPDGKKIAFVSDREGNTEIYVMNADGTNVVNLIKHQYENYKPGLVAGWDEDCL